MYIPRIVTINDLSSLGKCSLTVAIPILSVMGVQACPLPTNLYSSQTGFPLYAHVDLSAYIEAFSEAWKAQDMQFDGIYTGFLASAQQAKQVKETIRQFNQNGSFVLVDPVLGDDGGLYPCFEQTMVEAVREVVGMADIITPNLTEACLLTGTDYIEVKEKNNQDIWLSIAKQLSAIGPKTVIITGIEDKGEIYTLAYLAKTDKLLLFHHPCMGQSFSGTGDIMASILCGAIARGQSVEEALALSHTFLSAAIAESVQHKTDPKEGIAFEHHLHLLFPKH